MESNQVGNAATRELNLPHNICSIGTMSSGSDLTCHGLVQHKIPSVTPPYSNTDRTQSVVFPVLTSFLEPQICNSKAESNATPIMTKCTISKNTLESCNQARNLPAPIVTPQQCDVSNKQTVCLPAPIVTPQQCDVSNKQTVCLPAPIVTPQQGDVGNKQTVCVSEVLAQQCSDINSELNQAMQVIAPKYIHNNGIQGMNTMMTLVIPHKRNMNSNQEVDQTACDAECRSHVVALQSSTCNMKSESNQAIPVITPQYTYNNEIRDINRVMSLVNPQESNRNSNQNVGQKTQVYREILPKCDLNSAVNQPTSIVTSQRILKNRKRRVKPEVNQPTSKVTAQPILKNQSCGVKPEVNQPTSIVTAQRTLKNQSCGVKPEVNQPTSIVTAQRILKNQSCRVNQPIPIVAPRQRTVNTAPDAHW